MNDRALFRAALCSGPMLRGDAIVVCCGEDADARVTMAAGLFMTGGAPTIVLSGGRHDPPRWISAPNLVSTLYAKGVAPDRILLDPDSPDTRAQSVAIARLAADNGWKRVLVVASSYHMDRAYLTFLQALTDVGHDRVVQLLAVPATQSPWFSAPPGMTETRAELLVVERAKIDQYIALGHCASYADGVAALRFWEQGPPDPLAQLAPSVLA